MAGIRSHNVQIFIVMIYYNKHAWQSSHAHSQTNSNPMIQRSRWKPQGFILQPFRHTHIVPLYSVLACIYIYVYILSACEKSTKRTPYVVLSADHSDALVVAVVAVASLFVEEERVTVGTVVALVEVRLLAFSEDEVVAALVTGDVVAAADGVDVRSLAAALRPREHSQGARRCWGE